jgi:hypothetical protein
MGFARLFRPTLAGANMGHPLWFVSLPATLESSSSSGGLGAR